MINVCHLVSGKTWGGAERYASDVMERLRHDKDFYVEMVCGKNDTIIGQFQHLDIPVSILPLRGLADFDSPVRLARLLRKGKNIVHAHTVKDAATAVLAKRLSENAQVRVLLTPHGLKKPRLNYWHKKALRGVDRFVFVSQLARDTFASHARKVDLARSVVIRESVLERTPASEDLRKTYHIGAEKKILFFHGRLSNEKGVDTLLRSVTQLDKSRFHLLLAGDGHPKSVSQFKAFVIANQLVGNVTFLEFKDNIQALLPQVDICVLPSTTPEASGIACLEALMCGRALITTANGAQREYVSDNLNGLIVEPGNFMQLAFLINALLDDDARRDSLGRTAREYFDKNLRYELFYDKLTALYRELF